MRHKYTALGTAVGLAAVLMLGQILFGQPPGQVGAAAPAGARGQGGGGRGAAAAPPAGPIVRTKDGKPDFNGYWMTTLRDTRPNFERNVVGNKIPYTPEWEEKSADVKKSHMF